MKKHYPGEGIASKDFYRMVGQTYVNAVTAQPEDYENTCAARMSYALNRSGLKLPVAPGGGNLVGDDKFNYWLRVAQLKKKLETHLGKPDHGLTHQKIERTSQREVLQLRLKNGRQFVSEISTKKGIIAFDVLGFGNATGHFTLWDGKNLVYVGPPGDHNDPNSYAYYFWFIRTFVTDKVTAQTTRVSFWELK